MKEQNMHIKLGQIIKFRSIVKSDYILYGRYLGKEFSETEYIQIEILYNPMPNHLPAETIISREYKEMIPLEKEDITLLAILKLKGEIKC